MTKYEKELMIGLVKKEIEFLNGKVRLYEEKIKFDNEKKEELFKDGKHNQILGVLDQTCKDASTKNHYETKLSEYKKLLDKLYK